MTSAAPWWASAGADDLDRDEDPLAAHVAARGLGLVGEPDDAPPGGRTGGSPGHARDHTGEVGEDDSAESPPGGDGSGAGGRAHDPAICGVCPLCRGWAGLQERHPDVADHLAEAARHVALALSSFADAVDTQRRADTSGPDPSAADFTDIPLDDDRPAAP